MRPSTRIMYIEYKGADNLIGDARIGRVKFSRSGKSIHYKNRTFESLKGSGFKSNFFDVETGEHYWISGCRKDGRDALYSTTAEIDDDVREEYWIKIRGMPENIGISSIKVSSKY
ncbi:1-deoxy-D-xylulose-5-phosphate synthase [Bacterioplanoides sp. SCSIO 12839]|uniref:1-deoxy-D-xylulose-5-phosphate synthase n=1 Tax=Bacterioplanoides sp. SCSIO 12839 TaxID=2829569 RepID=UPI002103E654|nr:1-deoxy-D-xylulose-5-phosphate synthase [Bacterioplanoides sp. SCSIO 12839]UTW48189.1 1-deoxy-D-xylulose-5-phosphate synthase [Bacterioplanoides sp. SCSIO 12839]